MQILFESSVFCKLAVWKLPPHWIYFFQVKNCFILSASLTPHDFNFHWWEKQLWIELWERLIWFYSDISSGNWVSCSENSPCATSCVCCWINTSVTVRAGWSYLLTGWHYWACAGARLWEREMKVLPQWHLRDADLKFTYLTKPNSRRRYSSWREYNICGCCYSFSFYLTWNKS